MEQSGKWGWVQPEYRKFEHIRTPFNALFLKLSHKPMEILLHAAEGRRASQRWLNVPSENGGIPVLLTEPEDGDEETLPCMVYMHGGGFGFEAAPQHRWLVGRLARDARCRVLTPDYRLLPEHPYPAAREDGIAVYEWACRHAEELKIDLRRMAAGGDSAGGALATYLCADAEAKGLPAPVFQMLIYPVADARMETASMKTYTDSPMWNAEHNAKMWSMYLAGQERPEASPMQAPLPKRVPDTYVEVAELDCLHDEGVAYARRLEAAGARVELREQKGVFHGYDVEPRSAVMKECYRTRTEALKRALHGEENERDSGEAHRARFPGSN